MDKNHIEYCRKLGNPYMKKKAYEETAKIEEIDFSWMPETEQEDWLKNTKKFTN